MNAINLAAAILGGAGITLLFFGLTGGFGRPAHRLEADGAARPPRRNLHARLVALLYQARAPLSPAEFLAASLGIGALVAAGFFFLTGGLLVSAAGLLAGIGLYYLYLLDRRDRARIEYESAQPEVADLMAAAFRTRGYNLPAVLSQVIENGPEVAREDWVRLAAALESRHPDDAAIAEVLAYRASPGLWQIVEAVRLFRGELERLAPLLVRIQRDLAQSSALEREIAAEMVGPRRQLLYVAAMPAVLLAVFILFSPEIGAFYASLLGQVLLLGVLGASAAIYALGTAAAERRMRLHTPGNFNTDGGFKLPGSAVPAAPEDDPAWWA